MDKKPYLVTVIVVLVIAVIILAAFIGFLLGRSPKIEEKITEALPEAFVPPLAAPEAPPYTGPIATEVTTISGAIKEIKSNALILETIDLSDIKSLLVDPNAPQIEERPAPKFKNVKVLVDEKTLIRKSKPVPPPSAGGPAATPVTDPSALYETLTLSDLKVGDNVGVFSDKDVKDADSFTALEILLIQ